MALIRRLVQGMLFGLFLAQLSHSQSGPEIWRCGNLLTNQPIPESLDPEKIKCRPLDNSRASVTFIGNSRNLKAPSSSNGDGGQASNEKITGTLGSDSLRDQPSSREQMSKSILINERDRLIARQAKLESKLKQDALSTADQREIQDEINRNQADLSGLRREIAKLP